MRCGGQGRVKHTKWVSVKDGRLFYQQSIDIIIAYLTLEMLLLGKVSLY